jgi:hypothetical protein
MAPAQAEITLRIELDSEPIEGFELNPDGTRRPFSGWIQLVALLQRAATTTQTSSRPPGSDPPRTSLNGKARPGSASIGDP